MAECKFTTKYRDYEGRGEVDYTCDSKDEDIILDSGLCIFHDKNYLQDGNNRVQHEQNIIRKVMDKINDASFRSEILRCIGYHFPSNIRIVGDFVKPIHFVESNFQEVDFSRANFLDDVDFSGATFSGKADFTGAHFNKVDFYKAHFSNEAIFTFALFHGDTNFTRVQFMGREDFSVVGFYKRAYFTGANFSDEAIFQGTDFGTETSFGGVLFESGGKVRFEVKNLSKVSFMNTDITRVRFSDRARWGEKDRFKVVEEEMLENSLLEKSPQQVSLGGVMAVYRNLRENYEFRLRYDEAGKFFIKEMELKRKYREVLSEDGNSIIVKPNCWFRRNLSLTGLYYHLSRYGENLLRPTLLGIAIVFGSTLFWLMQSNPYAEPSLSRVTGFTQVVANHTQWQKAFERSFADFLPLLPLGSKIQVGLSDYVIKILGGALTFGFIAIALRRKFERKYTR